MRSEWWCNSVLRIPTLDGNLMLIKIGNLELLEFRFISYPSCFYFQRTFLNEQLIGSCKMLTTSIIEHRSTNIDRQKFECKEFEAAAVASSWYNSYGEVNHVTTRRTTEDHVTGSSWWAKSSAISWVLIINCFSLLQKLRPLFPPKSSLLKILWLNFFRWVA